jgi:hypothetical protein
VPPPAHPILRNVFDGLGKRDRHRVGNVLRVLVWRHLRRQVVDGLVRSGSSGSGSTTDVFDRDAPPVLSVDPGDTVVVRSLDASGYLERQQWPGERRPTMFDGRRGHCLTGPIEVCGAEPGNVLVVHIVSADPGDWGWTAAGVKDNAVNRARYHRGTFLAPLGDRRQHRDQRSRSHRANRAVPRRDRDAAERAGATLHHPAASRRWREHRLP